MSKVSVFVPKHEHDRRRNLREFIALVEQFGHLKPNASTSESYDYHSAYWPGVAHFTKMGVSSRQRGSEYELDPSFMPFAKAYFTYQQSHSPTETKNELKSLRAIEATMLAAYGEADITRLSAQDLDNAVQPWRAKASGYQAGRELERLLDFLVKKKIVPPFIWKNPIPRPQDIVDRVGSEGKKARAKRLPNEDALLAIAEIFSLENDCLSMRDVFTTSSIALLMAAPARGSELFYLREDCIHRAIDANGNEQVGLCWYSGKGFGYEVEWIPSVMVPVVETAVSRLQGLSEVARDFAARVESSKDFPRHPLCPDVQENSLLTTKEAVLALGLDLSRYKEERIIKDEVCTKLGIDSRQGKTSGCQLLRKYSVSTSDYAVSLRDLNKKVRGALPSGFPYVPYRRGQGVKVKWSNALYASFANSYHTAKATVHTELWMPQINTLNEDLAPTRKRNKDGSISSIRSIFERHGYSNFKITSHQLRHMLTTLAKQGGMSDSVLSRWAGRADEKQNRVYDNQTPEQLNVKSKAVLDKMSYRNKDGLGLTQIVVATPDTLQEVNADSNVTAHVTEYGMCIHSYIMSPCEKYRDCLNCEEHICIKGDQQKLERLKVQLDREISLLEGDRLAVEEGAIGAERFLNKRLLTVERLQGLINKLEDQNIPNGARIGLSIEPESRLDRAFRINGREKLPNLENEKRGGTEVLDRSVVGIEWKLRTDGSDKSG